MTIKEIMEHFWSIGVQLDAEIEREPDRPEVWRLQVARDSIARESAVLDRSDLTEQDKYWHAALILRGVFYGWADSSSSFIAPEDIHGRMKTLYDLLLKLSGRK